MNVNTIANKCISMIGSINNPELWEKKITEKAASFCSSYANLMTSNYPKPQLDLQLLKDNFKQHLNHIVYWANTIDFFHTTDSILTSTIPLFLMEVKDENPLFELQEDEIEILKKHILLTGQAGSGKSVVLKRVIMKACFGQSLTTTPGILPILIEFSKIPPGNDLFTFIAQLLGISYRSEKEIHNVPSIKEELMYGHYTYTPETVQKEKIVHYVQKAELGDLLINLIDTAGLYLYMDGFDQANAQIKEIVAEQLIELSKKLKKARMMVTSKPDIFSADKAGFRKIVPRQLTPDQQMNIITHRIKDKEKQGLLKQIAQNNQLFSQPGMLAIAIFLAINSPEFITQLGNMTAKYFYELFKKKYVQYRARLLVVEFNLSADLEHKLSRFIEQALEKTSYGRIYLNSSFIIEDRSFISYYIQLFYYGQKDDTNNNRGKEAVNMLPRIRDLLNTAERGEFQFSNMLLRYLYATGNIVQSYLDHSISRLRLKGNPYPYIYSLFFTNDAIADLLKIVNNIKSLFSPPEQCRLYNQLLTTLLCNGFIFSVHEKTGISFLKIIDMRSLKDAALMNICYFIIKKDSAIVDSIRLVLQKYDMSTQYIVDSVCYKRTLDHTFNFYPPEFSIPKILDKMISTNAD